MLPMLKDQNMLNLESNARIFIEDFNENGAVMISKEITQL